MRRLLQRRSPGQGQQWRRVPRINVLSGRRRSYGSVGIVRGLLVLLLLLGLFWSLSQYRSRTTIAESNAKISAELKKVQSQVSTEQQRVAAGQQKIDAVQQEIKALQTRLTQLQQQRNDRQQAYQAVTAGRPGWHAAYSKLLTTEVQGVKYQSVTVQPDDKLTLTATAADLAAIARWQTQLKDVSDVLPVQSVRWESKSNSLAITAVFRVRR